MADVFLAERESGGVTLRAAVKRLRPSRHDAEIERRFEREGRILARLEDERIARLLDAGVDDSGRAWLATELIDGERIDLYCRRLALDLDARLALFLDVAAAVAVAHRQLIVHRDIKPANVLVTARGRVKLLDFGIAKLLHDSSDVDARLEDPPTRAEIRLMTPEYAAPEQLLSRPVGTATAVRRRYDAGTAGPGDLHTLAAARAGAAASRRPGAFAELIGAAAASATRRGRA